MKAHLRESSFKRLVSLAGVVGASLLLGLPDFAVANPNTSGSTASSKEVLAQSGSGGSGSPAAPNEGNTPTRGPGSPTGPGSTTPGGSPSSPSGGSNMGGGSGGSRTGEGTSRPSNTGGEVPGVTPDANNAGVKPSAAGTRRRVPGTWICINNVSAECRGGS